MCRRRPELDRTGSLLVLLVLSSPRLAFADWSGVAPMPVSRAYHASATVQNRWYVAGGVSVDAAGPHYLPDVHAFDPKTGTWKLVGQLTAGREYLAAVTAPKGAEVL